MLLQQHLAVCDFTVFSITRDLSQYIKTTPPFTLKILKYTFSKVHKPIARHRYWGEASLPRPILYIIQHVLQTQGELFYQNIIACTHSYTILVFSRFPAVVLIHLCYEFCIDYDINWFFKTWKYFVSKYS